MKDRKVSFEEIIKSEKAKGKSQKPKAKSQPCLDFGVVWQFGAGAEWGREVPFLLKY